MNLNYDDNAKIIKALSDSSRLKIIDILSCGESVLVIYWSTLIYTANTFSSYEGSNGLWSCRI